jgi:hypothetical protein
MDEPPAGLIPEEMMMAKHKPTFLGRLSISLLVIIIGLPIGYLLLIGTWGTIGIPFVVAIYAVPLFLLHYLVWGRAFSKRLDEEAQACVTSLNPNPDAPPESN